MLSGDTFLMVSPLRYYILRVAAAPLYFAGVRVEDLRRTPVPELQHLYVDECRDLPSGGLPGLKSDPSAGAPGDAAEEEAAQPEAEADGSAGSRLWARGPAAL